MKRILAFFCVFSIGFYSASSFALQDDIKTGISALCVLDDYEIEVVNRVVGAYDNFVRSRIRGEMPIEKAYDAFFAEQARYIHPPARIDRLEPDSAFIDDLMVEFIKDELRLPFVYRGHEILKPKYYGNEDGVIVKCEYCFGIEFERVGKVLALLAESNGLWDDTGLKDRVLASGTLHPVAIASSFNEKFDYSNKIERYLVALSHIERYLSRKFIYNVVRK